MEFIQFHPTTLYSPGNDRFLISEAVRGEGGVLRNQEGEAFMERYHPQGDLAPRDTVARAIDSEIKRSGANHIWLDVTGLSADFIRERFPQIYRTCHELGIDITENPIPVVPAAHYLCGGVTTDLSGATSLPGLYACGEVASTGLHGANRLASNSLLEALVVAHRGAHAVNDYLRGVDRKIPDLPDWEDEGVTDSDEQVVLTHNWEELRHTMWDYVGIVRTTKRLERARTRIGNLAHEVNDYYWNFKVTPRLLELRNLILVADLIVRCAMQRRESRGLHHTRDYPVKKPLAEDTLVSNEVLKN